MRESSNELEYDVATIFSPTLWSIGLITPTFTKRCICFSYSCSAYNCNASRNLSVISISFPSLASLTKSIWNCSFLEKKSASAVNLYAFNESSSTRALPSEPLTPLYLGTISLDIPLS